MATRARIGIQNEDGTITAAYQHWDGYPGGLGYNLIDNWYKADKVAKAIELGNSSKWGQIIGSKIDFDDRQSEMYDYQNVYYTRDRGEKDQGPKTYKDEADYLDKGFNSGEEYIYLAKNTGEKDYLGNPQVTWFYAAYDKSFFLELEEVAIKEHIDMLKRHLEMRKKEAA